MKAMMHKTLSAPGMLKLLDAAFRKIELPLRREFRWARDLPLSKGNVKKVAEAARTRWKIENETIKTLKDLEGCRLKRQPRSWRVASAPHARGDDDAGLSDGQRRVPDMSDDPSGAGSDQDLRGLW